MDSMDDGIPRLALLVALGIALGCLALIPAIRAWRKRERPNVSTRSAVRHTCSNCQRDLLFSPSELVPLSPAEIALTVSVVPEIRGRKLSEYDCPHCAASHTFAVDQPIPVFVTTNNYNPERASNHCANCHKNLVAPPWPPGEHDGHVLEAPGLSERMGLRCHRCGAVSCVACCRSITRNRTRDGSLLCARCDRGPIEHFHHW